MARRRRRRAKADRLSVSTCQMGHPGMTCRCAAEAGRDRSHRRRAKASYTRPSEARTGARMR